MKKLFAANKNIKKTLVSPLFSALSAVLLLTTLTGCGRNNAALKPDEPAPDLAAVSTAAPGESAAYTARHNGERFEDIIILEGMEETVRYEHVRNDTIGFEMDYDYENFQRLSEADRECFVSSYDDRSDPVNYLALRCSPNPAESVAAAICDALSRDYEISRNDSFMLARAGRCIRIDASAEKGGLRMPDMLQMVYIIPAADGCRVATAHYSIEGAEGFGRRFHYFMDTFSVIPALEKTRISDEQALAAIRNYCYLRNPDLESIVNAGQNTVYWEVSESTGSQIVILFRSYTGALIRYYIDPFSGDTYVTEFVPGITPDEQQTDESFNVIGYLA